MNEAMVGELWPSAKPVYDMSMVGSVTRATCKTWRTVTCVFLCPGIFALDGRASFVHDYLPPWTNKSHPWLIWNGFAFSSASTGLLSCGFWRAQFS
ncbi:hypothetical protein F5148DRAFT_1160899, partial [Russula earlei]